jgi:CYTH domain-containing protein
MEIERKFIPHNLPYKLSEFDCVRLEQAYISTNPVIRVRQKSFTRAGDSKPESDSYVLTVKSSGMMSRQEFELDLEEESYRRLLSKAEGNIISKHRYFIPLDGGLTLELDIFDGIFEGLTIGEIEFPNEEAAKKYTPPEFLSEEVTFDTRFHNSSLSVMTKADISDLISGIH